MISVSLKKFDSSRFNYRISFHLKMFKFINNDHLIACMYDSNLGRSHWQLATLWSNRQNYLLIINKFRLNVKTVTIDSMELLLKFQQHLIIISDNLRFEIFHRIQCDTMRTQCRRT